MGNSGINGLGLCRAALGGLFACTLLTTPISASAQAGGERQVSLDYAVYVGGFETIKVSFDTALGGGDYKMKMALDGQGILEWWFSWRLSAFSEGRLTDGTFVPVRAGADSRWNGEQRKIRLSYEDGKPPTATIIPKPENDDRDEVPPNLRAGARDLAGAVLAGLSRMGGRQGCAVREPVFDGRRRYNLILDHLGQEVIERNEFSPYAGPALRCGVKIERVAGFKRNPKRVRWRSSDGATVWVGQVFDVFPPVPVRMEMDTLLGAVRVHLVKATLKEGAKTRSLAALTAPRADR